MYLLFDLFEKCTCMYMIYNLYQQNQLEMNYPSETFRIDELNVFFSCGSSGTYVIDLELKNHITCTVKVMCIILWEWTAYTCSYYYITTPSKLCNIST